MLLLADCEGERPWCAFFLRRCDGRSSTPSLLSIYTFAPSRALSFYISQLSKLRGRSKSFISMSLCVILQVSRQPANSRKPDDGSAQAPIYYTVISPRIAALWIPRLHPHARFCLYIQQDNLKGVLLQRKPYVSDMCTEIYPALRSSQDYGL